MLPFAENNALTQTELKRQLHYDPLTGIFTRLISTNSRVNVGDTAGTKSTKNGYVQIMINGKQYRAHRLAFLYMTGSFPSKHVDHKFGIKDDNRWSELREASNQQNTRNSAMKSNNTSGFKGVTWNKKAQKWAAYSRDKNKTVYLGLFDNPVDASKAYINFSKPIHGDFFNHKAVNHV